MYRIIFTVAAEKAIRKLSSNEQAMSKLENLLEEIKLHPRFGTGKIERLKHYNVETWSRRIDKKNRIVYSIDDTIVTVTIISVKGHYENK